MREFFISSVEEWASFYSFVFLKSRKHRKQITCPLLHQIYCSYIFKIPFFYLTFQFRGLTLPINMSREATLIAIYWGFQIDLFLIEVES